MPTNASDFEPSEEFEMPTSSAVSSGPRETAADRAARLALRCGELSRDVKDLQAALVETQEIGESYWHRAQRAEAALGELACDCDDYEGEPTQRGWSEFCRHMTHRLSAAQARLAKVETLRDDLAKLDPSGWVGPWVHSLNVLDRLNQILDPTPAAACTYCGGGHALEECSEYGQGRTDEDEGAREGFGD